MPVVQRFSGARLEQLRNAKHLTQHDLASKLRVRGFGTTQTTISRWESGQRPSAAVLPALAVELGCEISDLYAADDDEEADQAMRLRRFRAELVLLGRDDLAEELKEIARVTGGVG